MQKIISATEARIHFGEVLQNIKDGPVIVERSGEPLAVVLSKSDYDQLVAEKIRNTWKSLLDETHRHVIAERKGKSIPSPEDLLNDIRQERDNFYDNLR